MRKLTWGLAVGALCAAAACGGLCEAETRRTEPEARLVLVSNEKPASWAHVCIVYDKETRVMYMMTRNSGIEPMIDTQGNPLLYTEE